MRLPDFWTGLLFAILGIAVAYMAQSFHVSAGAASPKVFPTIIGSVMAVLGAAIALRGWRSAGDVSLPAWISSPRQIALVIFLPIAIISFGHFAPIYGTIPVAFCVLTIHCLIYGLRIPVAVAIGAVASLVVTLVFMKLLGVPLPEGIIEEYLR